MDIDALKQELIKYFFVNSLHDSKLILEMYEVNEWDDKTIIQKAEELGLIDA